MIRIGLLTSGGDCQALNATMRGIIKTLLHETRKVGERVEIIGFEDGYQGLILSCLMFLKQMVWIKSLQ